MEKDATASINATLNELIASRRLVVSSKGPLWYVFPLMKHKLYMKYVYDSKLKLCHNNGILSAADSIKEHISLGLWNESKDKKLEKIPEFIKETENKIKREVNKLRKKKFEVWLRTLQREYYQLLTARNTILLNSAEFLANESAATYLLWECLRTYDDAHLWPTFQDMENQDDIAYIAELQNLFTEASKDQELIDIRAMAKLPHWRVRWKSVDGDLSSLFGRTAQDLTNDQFLLVYWSSIYDSVYESFERPPDRVIQDDDSLDEWLEQQAEKREREVSQKFYGKSTTSGGNKKSKIDDASEVYKVIEGYYDDKGVFKRYTEEERWQEIERIRKLNSSHTRAIKQREEKRLAKTPGIFVQEHELRKRKEDREAMGGNLVPFKRNR